MSDRIANARESETGCGEPGAVRMVSTFPSNAVLVFEAIAASGADGHDQARVHGALGYANPSEGLHDPKLSMEQKRNVLRQWAFDAYRMEVAATEGIRPSAPSGLDEAIDARQRPMGILRRRGEHGVARRAIDCRTDRNQTPAPQPVVLQKAENAHDGEAEER